MTDEKKIVSWDELENVEDVFTKTVHCPNLSAAIGSDVNVKIKAITPQEFLAAINFPMAEIDQMVADNAESAEFVKAIQEQSRALGFEGLQNTMESIVKLGMVEPDPESGNLGKLASDFQTIFKAIVDLSMPGEEVAEAAQFRPDGE